MNEERFISRNKEKWTQLESYNERLTPKGLSRLNKDELKNYTELYRMIGHHLAYAKTHFRDSKTTLYLNQLVGTAHNTFYVRERNNPSDVLNYFIRYFPLKIRRHYKYIAAASLCFLLGFLFCSVLVTLDEGFIRYFFSENMIIGTDSTSGVGSLNYALMSSVVMTNNLRVAFMAVTMGILGGIGTLYVLFINGMMLGGLTGYTILKGGSMLSYWALILPHGFLELGAIFISGGAGLMIGKALLIPGELRRRDSLIKSAKEAAGLLPGIVIMLILAGLIEGFITPSPIHAVIKIAFSAVTLLVMVLYFAFA